MKRIIFIMLIVGCAFLIVSHDLTSHESTPEERFDSSNEEINPEEILPQFIKNSPSDIVKSPMVTTREILASLKKGLPEEKVKKLIRHIDEEKDEHRQLSKEAWIDHLSECPHYCAELVSHIVAIHLNHVSALPHIAVFFDYDKDSVERKYMDKIDELISYYNPSSKILVEGRASKKTRIGERGRFYNRDLSARRAENIRRILPDRYNIPEDKITYLHYGWDPPQLTKRFANLLEIHPTEYYEDIDQLNQSVILTVYQPDEY